MNRQQRRADKGMPPGRHLNADTEVDPGTVEGARVVAELHKAYEQALRDPQVKGYAQALVDAGFWGADAIRPVLFAARYGFAAMGDGSSCVHFADPSCGEAGCVEPAHQRLEHGDPDEPCGHLTLDKWEGFDQ